jgi:T5SS/PEP-CTERM-associated repeat protein/autotransporter-associated beta strand protein
MGARLFKLFKVVLLTGLFFGGTGLRAQFVWTGNGLTGALTDVNNWVGSAPLGLGTESITFGTTGNWTTLLVASSAFTDVTFLGTRPAYTFSGIGVIPVFTINGNVTLASGPSVLFDNTLGLSLAAGARTVDVGAATTLQINGSVGGTGSLTKIGTGTLFFGGANTYTGTTTINGGTLALTGGSISHAGADLTAGGNGSLAISNGGAASTNHGFIGYGSVGFATVAGSGSSWTLADELIVGAFTNGQGTLSISNGGVVSDLRGSISYIGPGTSIVTVDGAGSAWNNTNYVFVGSGGGNAQLNVNNGGTVISDSGAIGLNSGYGQATINGAGSNWTITSSLNVGDAGTGIFELLNDGRLNLGGGSGTITLGNNGGSGTLLVGDSEYATNAGIFNAATITTGTGTGTVNFNNGTTRAAPYYLTKDGTAGGAPVLITGATVVNQQFGYNVLTGANTYTGATTINGGTMVAGNNTALGTGAVTLNGGRLNLNSGVTLANPIGFGGSGGTLGGSGTFASAITAGTNVHLAPGFLTGTLSFNSGLALASGGTLDFEVQSATGAAGTGYDLVSVSGAVLDITATSGAPFTLRLVSLDLAGNPGNVSDFSAAGSYSWIIATSVAGLNNFAADKFLIDTTGFSNSLGIGSFSVAAGLSGGNLALVLNFTAVPEPSTYALMIMGLASVIVSVRRRNRLAP